jgi:hypothetical protein
VSRLHKGLILVAGLAVIFCLAVCLNARRELLDRLEHAGCGGPAKAPPATPVAPHRSQVSD